MCVCVRVPNAPFCSFCVPDQEAWGQNEDSDARKANQLPRPLGQGCGRNRVRNGGKRNACAKCPAVAACSRDQQAAPTSRRQPLTQQCNVSGPQQVPQPPELHHFSQHESRDEQHTDGFMGTTKWIGCDVGSCWSCGGCASLALIF